MCRAETVRVTIVTISVVAAETIHQVLHSPWKE